MYRQHNLLRNLKMLNYGPIIGLCWFVSLHGENDHFTRINVLQRPYHKCHPSGRHRPPSDWGLHL